MGKKKQHGGGPPAIANKRSVWAKTGGQKNDIQKARKSETKTCLNKNKKKTVGVETAWTQKSKRGQNATPTNCQGTGAALGALCQTGSKTSLPIFLENENERGQTRPESRDKHTVDCRGGDW